MSRLLAIREKYPTGVAGIIADYYCDIVTINSDYLRALCEGDLRAIIHIEQHYSSLLLATIKPESNLLIALKMGHMNLVAYFKAQISVLPISGVEYPLNILLTSEERVTTLLPLFEDDTILFYLPSRLDYNDVGFVRAFLQNKAHILPDKPATTRYWHAHASPEMAYCFLKYRPDIAFKAFHSYVEYKGGEEDSVSYRRLSLRDCLLLDYSNRAVHICPLCREKYSLQPFECPCRPKAEKRF